MHSKKTHFSSHEIVTVLTTKWLFGFSLHFLLAKTLGHGHYFKLALAMILEVITKNGALKDPLKLWFSSLLPGEHQHFCLLVQGSITEDIIHLWYIFKKIFLKSKQPPQITSSTPFLQAYFWLYLVVTWSSLASQGLPPSQGIWMWHANLLCHF